MKPIGFAKITFLLVAVFTDSNFAQSDTSQRLEHRFTAMGVEIKIIAYSSNAQIFEDACDEAFHLTQRLESVFSDYSPDSECQVLTKSAPHEKPVDASEELIEVLKISREIHHKTLRAFDPAIGTITSLWRMARKRNRLPDPRKIRLAHSRSGLQNIQMDLNNRKIQILQPGLKFDFGGIAKGYAADKILQLFKRHGLDSVLVDLGGDIAVGAKPPNSFGWTIQIHTPDRSGSVLLNLHHRAVATSGDASQRLIKNGVRYSHIIDPRTGKALEDSTAVTVISAKAVFADALASAFSVLGTEASFLAISDFPDTDYRFDLTSPIDTNAQTSGFNKYVLEKSIANPTSSLSDRLIDKKD